MSLSRPMCILIQMSYVTADYDVSEERIPIDSPKVEHGPAGTTCRCLRCGHVWVSRTDEPKRCPRCSSYLWNKPGQSYRCSVCGHTWTARAKWLPTICPKCKSRKWNGDSTSLSDGALREKVRMMHSAGMTSVVICAKLDLSFGKVMELLKN